ncbi:MAG: hypothetical protein H7Y42_12330 [Chitinophagaceae bacterium]|nr:hypothetical protein [Chitinophagaceae bacterium]
MPGIDERYENLHRRNISAINKRIRKIYENSIQEIRVTLSTVTYKNKPFNLADYPALKKKVDAVAKKMHASIYAVTVNGIRDSWSISNEKNDVLVDERFKGKDLNPRVARTFYKTNQSALDRFIKRKEKGLNLSDRVWNLLNPFKKELEQTIGLGLGSGRSAADIASDVKKYLNQPDRLFRRVRSEDGKLHLSAAARDYHPGQGVYRSSYKNALRLTMTENNIAYRTADHHRWQEMPFVLGIEVKLSNAHPRYDICDPLAGTYPKDFKFTGWHPQCLCYQVPKLMNDEDFEEIEDLVLAGEDPGTIGKGSVTRPPPSFTEYLKQNKGRMEAWKNKPYWMLDNKKYL